MMTEMQIALGYDDMGNNRQLLAEYDHDRIEEGKWYRADNSVICETCGLRYGSHSQVQGALWLRRICSGDLVKL